MNAIAPISPPRHGDGKYAEYLSSQPEGTLDAERNAEALSRLVGSTIASRAGRYRLSPDDIDDARQEVMVQVLEAQRRRGAPLTLEEDGGLVRTMTRTVLSRGKDENFKLHHRDRRAFGMWREEIEQLSLGGVSVNKALADEVAERIRMKFPSRERPSAGFHEPPSTVSFDTPIGENSSLGDVLPAPESTDAGFTSDDSAAARLAAAKANEEIDLTTAKRSVWDAIAETRGAPGVQARSIPSRRQADIRTKVAQVGGPLAAVEQWERGDLDGDGEAALFAPFGSDLGNQEMEQVGRMLRTYPDYANELWESALTVASTRARERL